VAKIISQEQIKTKKQKDRIENYEKFKMKDLYNTILFDDGKAPKGFDKENLAVERAEINEILNQDIRLNSRNLKSIKVGKIEQSSNEKISVSK
jgi:rRNA maturation endonuclease Nob1